MNCYSIAKIQFYTNLWQFDFSVCVHSEFSIQQSWCHFMIHLHMIFNDNMICVTLDEKNSISQKWKWCDNCVKSDSIAKFWFHTNFWTFNNKNCAFVFNRIYNSTIIIQKCKRKSLLSKIRCLTHWTNAI